MRISGSTLRGLITPNCGTKNVEHLEMSEKAGQTWVLNPNCITPTDVFVGTYAGNVSFTAKPPKGLGWRFRLGYLLLTCDATVANRYIYVEVCDKDGNTIHIAYVSAAVTASATSKLSFCHDYNYGQDMKICCCDAIPDGNKGEYFKIWISNGVAGDSFALKIAFDSIVIGE